jgi:hypothetical protein
MTEPAPTAPAPTASEGRTRGVLEIVTAILLGLVSVATAIGAYQAGIWGQQAGDLASISQQARDRNLSVFIERQIILRDDSDRLYDALALQAEGVFYPERAEATTAESELIIGAASPALAEGWAEWVESGFSMDAIPLETPQYEAYSYALPQSYNVASTLSDKSSRLIADRAHLMTIVSVVFALALLLLGVAGASSRLDVSAIMTSGGTAAFLAGVAVVIFGIF